MRGEDVHRAASEPDVRARNARLAGRHLRHDLQLGVLQERPHAKLLVDHRPRGAVVVPRLHDHRAACPAAVDVRRDARAGGDARRRREDLGQRARLLVGRVPGRRLGEHRLRDGGRVALLLAGAEPSVVPLAHGLDGRRQAEDLEVALAVGAAAAAGVVQAAVARPVAAEARSLAPRERRRPVVVRRHARSDGVTARQLRLHRDLADPVLLERLLVARVDQGVRVLLHRRVPPRLLELRAQLRREPGRPAVGRQIALGLVGEVVQRPHVVDAVV